MIPPQPPRPDMQPATPPVSQPDLKSQPQIVPPEQARIDAPPEPSEQRVEPPQPARTEPPRHETAPVPQSSMRTDAVPDAPRVVPPAPPQQVAEPHAVPEAERSFLTSYEKSLSELIKRHERYPDRARRQGWQGTTIVGLSLSADGKVKDVSILESSGREVLDDAAVQMVRRASPLPRAPEALQGKERIVRIPIVFKLTT
jgi:periplasmic protein TonB